MSHSQMMVPMRLSIVAVLSLLSSLNISVGRAQYCPEFDTLAPAYSLRSVSSVFDGHFGENRVRIFITPSPTDTLALRGNVHYFDSTTVHFKGRIIGPSDFTLFLDNGDTVLARFPKWLYTGYESTWNRTGDTISGAFLQNGNKFAVSLLKFDCNLCVHSVPEDSLEYPLELMWYCRVYSSDPLRMEENIRATRDAIRDSDASALWRVCNRPLNVTYGRPDHKKNLYITSKAGLRRMMRLPGWNEFASLIGNCFTSTVMIIQEVRKYRPLPVLAGGLIWFNEEGQPMTFAFPEIFRY